jgi:FLVCR family MFS transporter
MIICLFTNECYFYFFEGLFYFFCIAGGTLVNGAFPLFFELSCETTYPIAEGITAGFLTLALNITGSLFLLLSLIPNIGKS